MQTQSIHIKDLQAGDYLINHGLVKEVTEYRNAYEVVFEAQTKHFVSSLGFGKSISVEILSR